MDENKMREKLSLMNEWGWKVTRREIECQIDKNAIEAVLWPQKV